MLFDDTFKIALLISLLTHGLLFFSLPRIKIPTFPKKLDKIEVTYLEPKTQVSLPEKKPPKEKLLDEDKPILSSNILPKDIFKPETAELKPPELSKIEEVAPKPKINLGQVMPEIKSPGYLNYYQIIRERIRKCAYRNFVRLRSGEVYLSFVVSSDGQLKAVRLIEEKSSPDSYLRQISIQSIKEAAPFPQFPKELNYPELSFNIIISFETE